MERIERVDRMKRMDHCPLISTISPVKVLKFTAAHTNSLVEGGIGWIGCG